MNWYENDKFYQELNEEEKQEFIKQISTYMISSRQSIGKKSRGPIRDCPTCKEKRTTDISVCSCGSCLTCGYRWFCQYNLDKAISIILNDNINTSPPIRLISFPAPSEDYIDFP